MAGRFTAILKTIKRQAAFAVCLFCFSFLLTLYATAQTAPQRVVSLNLCTDILALSLAAPDQVVSVSHIAADPVSSPVAGQVGGLHLNHAGLEEILALKPELVLASIYTAPEKLAVLEKAGIQVERFGYAQDFADIREQIKQMGNALGRSNEADTQLDEIDRVLAGLHSNHIKRTAVIYEPNGLTSGAGTLADETLRALGLTNLAADSSELKNGHVGLEALVKLHPDYMIVPEFYEKPALAYQNYRHPVMGKLMNHAQKPVIQIAVPMRYWSCGSAYTLEAVKLLQAALMAAETGGE